jgi:hypothetical protein
MSSSQLDDIVFNALTAVSDITAYNFVRSWCVSTTRERRLQTLSRVVSYELQFDDVSNANTFADAVQDSDNKATIAEAFMTGASEYNITLSSVEVSDVSVSDNYEIPSGVPSLTMSVGMAMFIFPGFF